MLTLTLSSVRWSFVSVSSRSRSRAASADRPSRLALVDRAATDKAFKAGRDLGLMIHNGNKDGSNMRSVPSMVTGIRVS